MKLYTGTNTDGSKLVECLPFRLPTMAVFVPSLRTDLVHHAVDYDWGRGSDPDQRRQLALAILADALTDHRTAVDFHLRFADEIVGEWPAAGWSVWCFQLAEWVAAQGRRKRQK